ncbi:hypothetical protein A3K73_01000 [Candidatus Pacearchaeota archaeon RBG_13_36_9]|nr:MAG: hypothetical protein A3K73_01000 [Candidatus Pacearchaeota archaeon RBG_13_36_9]
MGTCELSVEQELSCIVIHPKTGEINAVIPQAMAAKKAKFESSNSSGVRFKLNRASYVVKYKQKK